MLGIDDDGTYSALAQHHTSFVSHHTALGIDVFAVGIQNEPQHGANDYPSMVMTLCDERSRDSCSRKTLES